MKMEIDEERDMKKSISTHFERAIYIHMYRPMYCDIITEVMHAYD